LYFVADDGNKDPNIAIDGVTIDSNKTRLYPSCNFINIPNKYKTIKTGETYDHIIDITPWRDSRELWSVFKDKERVEGVFSIIIIYPHVHYYSVGNLKWRGWY